MPSVRDSHCLRESGMTYYLSVKYLGIFNREALCEHLLLLEMPCELKRIRQDTSRYIPFFGKQELRTIQEKSVRKTDQNCSIYYGTAVQM